ncbi:MAG: ABC transporter ATP-binding protein [Desulfomonilaceae bacterium]|nr:ABC transporter ATP-binding protein [Desulfomonilaceae bacterium]
MTPVYRMEHVSFRYGECPVLDVSSLEILPGEIVALAGPNGAGKTTLLHLMAFVESPSNGDIFFFDEKLRHDNIISLRRRVGLLLQNPYLFHTTVIGNLLWGLKLRGCSRTTARDKALRSLRSVGLSGFEYRDARKLSGGETQRVALARALALDPDVLLLDEPANHMDRESIRRTFEIVRDINTKHGTSIVLTTHDIPKVQHLVNRVIHLRGGTVVPSLPENLFPGRLSEDGMAFDTGKILVRLPDRAAEGSQVAVDPTKVRISTSLPGSPGPNSFHGTVVSLKSGNGTASIHIDAGERFQVVARADSPLISDLHLGREVWIMLPSDSISVF